MEKFLVEIRHEGKYTAVECSGNTPCLLADEIRKVVKEFYKNETEEK
jgi:uncharacterized protein YuzE